MLRLEGRADARPGRIPFRHARFLVPIWVTTITMLAVSSVALPNALGATGVEKAYRVKVAFLLDFASLIEWPDESFSDSDSPFVICHLGGSRTRKLFDGAYAGRMVDKHPIEVWHVSGAGDVQGCHIIMITAERSEQAGVFIAAAAGKSTLTVGETEGFALGGGVIGFYNDGPKIRFEINLRSAEEANLRISSRLLQLARLVSSDGE